MAGDVVIRILADGTVAVQGINDVNKSLGSVGDSAKKGGDGLEAFGKEVKTAAEGITAGLTASAALIDNINNIGVTSLRARAGLDAMTNSHADEFLQKMIASTRGLVDDTDLMQIATKALSAGVVTSSDGMAKLAEDGAALGRVFMGDAAGGINVLTMGLEGNTRGLKQLGINMASVTAEEQKLTDSGMDATLAKQTAIMDQADAATKRLGESAYGTGTALEKLKIQGNDLFESFSERAAQGIESTITGLQALGTAYGELYVKNMMGVNVTPGDPNYKQSAGALGIGAGQTGVGATPTNRYGAITEGLSPAELLQQSQGYGAITAGATQADFAATSKGANRDRNKSGLMTAADLEPALRTSDDMRRNGEAISAAFGGAAAHTRDLAIAAENAAASATKEAEARKGMTAAQILGAQSNTLGSDIASGADSAVSAQHAALQKELDKKVGHGDASGSGWAGGGGAAVDTINPKLAKAKAHYDDLAYSIAHTKHETESQALAFSEAATALTKLTDAQTHHAAAGGSTGRYKVYTKDDEAKDLAASDREAKVAKDQYMIATGQATAASIKEADIQADLNTKMANGTISAKDYYASLTLLYKGMEAGIKTETELGKLQFNINLQQGNVKNAVRNGETGKQASDDGNVAPVMRQTHIRTTAFDTPGSTPASGDPLGPTQAGIDKTQKALTDLGTGAAGVGTAIGNGISTGISTAAASVPTLTAAFTAFVAYAKANAVQTITFNAVTNGPGVNHGGAQQ